MKNARYILSVLVIAFYLVAPLCSAQAYDDEFIQVPGHVPVHAPAHVTGELLLKLNGINKELGIIRRTTPGGSTQLEEKEIVLHFALQKLCQRRYILNEEVQDHEEQSDDEAPAPACTRKPEPEELAMPESSKHKQQLHAREPSFAATLFSATILQYIGLSGSQKIDGLKKRRGMRKLRNTHMSNPENESGVEKNERKLSKAQEQREGLQEKIGDEGTLLDLAAMYNYREIARVLLADGLSCYQMNERGIIPLQRALDWGHYHLAFELIRHGTNWSFRDAEGRSVVHIVLNRQWRRGIRWVIRHATPDVLQTADQYGLTPLHIATFLGDDASVRKLLRRDAPLDAQDNKGRTPLHCATFGKNIQIVRTLVLKGAEVNVSDRNGNTPLHYAVKINSPEAIEFLLEAGADCEQENHRGFASVSWAGKFGTFELVKLLAQSDTFNRECCVCFEEQRRCVAPCPENCSHWICAGCLERMVQQKPQCRRCPSSEDARKMCVRCEKNFEAVFSECPQCCNALRWQCTNCSDVINYTFPHCPHCQAVLCDQSLYARCL